MLLMALAALLLLTACGPEKTTDEALAEKVKEIALDYQVSGDLAAARTKLEELDVANAHQWLLFTTETAIDENADANTVAAMVKLTQDLGLASMPVKEYALQNNLLAAGSVLAQSLTAGEQEALATATSPPAPSATPTELPTVAAEVAPTAVPTATPQTQAMAKANDALNVRAGPSTNYNVVGSLQKDELVQITGKNPDSDWWQVLLPSGATGWVFGQLTQTLGDTTAVAVAANIPPEPAPVAAAPAAPQESAAEAAPAVEAESPAAEAAPPTPDPNAPPHFTLVMRRLWEKQENDGCVGKHLLRINVLDAAGNRLNGVRLKGIYTGDELVTGDQGKGDGLIEYDLYKSGEGFVVIRDNDGREATSDRAEGFTTRSLDIDEETLINAHYCTNHEDCQIFYSSYGCQGHHSWEATFQRNY